MVKDKFQRRIFCEKSKFPFKVFIARRTVLYGQRKGALVRIENYSDTQLNENYFPTNTQFLSPKLNGSLLTIFQVTVSHSFLSR